MKEKEKRRGEQLHIRLELQIFRTSEAAFFALLVVVVMVRECEQQHTYMNLVRRRESIKRKIFNDRKGYSATKKLHFLKQDLNINYKNEQIYIITAAMYSSILFYLQIAPTASGCNIPSWYPGRSPGKKNVGHQIVSRQRLSRVCRHRTPPPHCQSQ